MMKYEYPDKEINHRQFERELEAAGVTGLLGVARLSRRTVDGVMVAVPKYLVIKIPELSSGQHSQLDAVVSSHSAESVPLSQQEVREARIREIMNMRDDWTNDIVREMFVLLESRR